MMECQGGCSSCRRRRFHLRHPRWGGEAYIFIPDSEDEDGDEVVANETGDGEDLFFIPDSKYVGMEAAVDDDLTFIPDSEATGVEAASGDFDVHDEGGVHALDVVVHEGGAQGKLALNVEDDEGGVHAVVGKNGMGSEDELVATVDIGGYSQDPYEDVDVNLEVGVEAEPYIDDDFVKQMLQVLVPSGQVLPPCSNKKGHLQPPQPDHLLRLLHHLLHRRSPLLQRSSQECHHGQVRRHRQAPLEDLLLLHHGQLRRHQ